MASVKFRKRPVMGALSECLERIKELRDQWGPEEEHDRRGEEQLLWFRGHADADWKLMPKLYRPEFAGADETEIPHEFQTRALQLIPRPMPTGRSEWTCP